MQSAAAQQRLQRTRQRQSAGTADDNLAGSERHVEIVGERLDRHPLLRGKRAELDEGLLMNHASHRRKRGDDEDLVARFRIGDAVQFMQRFERDAHGRAVGADQAAIEIERVYRRLNGIANLQRPRRPIGADARQARPIELDAHDVGVRRARQFGAANGVGCLAFESGKINVRFRVRTQATAYRPD